MSKIHCIRVTAVAAVFTFILSACGGGGGSSGTTVAAPTITAQPQNASTTTDGSVTLSVTATGTDLSYQWRRNGTAITGATSSSYTLSAASYTDNGAQYTVVVSNAGGSVTSSAATVSLAASANQQAFESLILAANGGSYYLTWNLNYGGPQISGTNYGYSSGSTLAASPATAGPQTTTQGGPVNMTTTLALPATSANRVLVGGKILAVTNGSETSRATYVGDNVQIETLATDGSVAYTEVRSDYRRVSLTGTMANTPAEFAQWFNSWFSNAAVLNASAAWQSGAAYIVYTGTNKGDRYRAFDCGATTTDANISPCRTGMTLNAAMTAGITSNSDGVTYTLNDGMVTTVSGVPVWVATASRPRSATLWTTVEHRIYFELNGNVYTGSLVQDGAVLGGSYYVSNPSGATVLDRLTFFSHRIRMNKAARDSLAAAAAI